MSIAEMIMRVRTYALEYILVVLVLISAISVVYIKHSSRTEFVVLQQLDKQRDHLDEEWGRLLLEESTWSGQSSIEKLASLHLNMIVPTTDMIILVKP